MESVQNLIRAVGRQTGQAARDLLSRSWTQEPGLFVLHLVAAAVASRATRIRARNDEADLVLEWDGLPPTPRALLDLYTNFEEASRDERTRYLALGLNYAFATGIGELRLESWDGNQGLRLMMSATGQSHQLLKLDPFQGQSLAVRIRCLERSKLRTLTRAVNHMAGASGLPELQLLEERCQWIGPELWIDRSPVQREVELGRVLCWTQLGPESPQPTYALRALRPRHGLEFSRVPATPFAAVLAFGSSHWDWQGLSPVVSGVVATRALPLAFRDLSGVLSAPHLEADVAFAAVQPSSALDTMLDIVNTVGVGMAEELLRQRERIGFDQSEIVARVFEDLARVHARQQRWESAVPALRAALEFREQALGVTHPDLVDGWTELLEWNRRLAQPTALQPIHERLIPLLRASAENLRRKHRLEEATGLWKRALQLEEQLPEAPAGLAERYHELASLVKEYRLPGAEELFRRALELRQGEGHSDPAASLASLLELADRHRSQRRLPEAEVQARAALELAERSYGPDSKELIPGLQLLAQILKAANRYAEATDFESRAMTLRFRR